MVNCNPHSCGFPHLDDDALEHPERQQPHAQPFSDSHAHEQCHQHPVAQRYAQSDAHAHHQCLCKPQSVKLTDWHAQSNHDWVTQRYRHPSLHFIIEHAPSYTVAHRLGI